MAIKLVAVIALLMLLLVFIGVARSAPASPIQQRPSATATPWLITTRQWVDGEGGRVKYGQNCDFRGSDIASGGIRNISSGEKCALLCLENALCTHFTHTTTTNTCHMKRATKMDDLRASASICGWIVGRSKQWIQSHPSFSISHLWWNSSSRLFFSFLFKKYLLSISTFKCQ